MLRLMTWLLRAVLVAAVLQFSGVAHYVVDAVQAVEGAAVHPGSESCPDDDADDCTGCPECHCVHLGCFVAPAVEVPGAFDDGTALSLPYVSTGPPRRDLFSLFRPPRTLA